MREMRILGTTTIEYSQNNGVSLPAQGFHTETSDWVKKIYRTNRGTNTASYIMRNNNCDPECQRKRFYARLEKWADINDTKH
jgi:hypothetical protein